MRAAGQTFARSPTEQPPGPALLIGTADVGVSMSALKTVLELLLRLEAGEKRKCDLDDRGGDGAEVRGDRAVQGLLAPGPQAPRRRARLRLVAVAVVRSAGALPRIRSSAPLRPVLENRRTHKCQCTSVHIRLSRRLGSPVVCRSINTRCLSWARAQVFRLHRVFVRSSLRTTRRWTPIFSRRQRVIIPPDLRR